LARNKGKLPKSKQPDAEVLGVLEEVLKNREAMYAGGTIEVRVGYPRPGFLCVEHVFPY